MCGFGLVDAIVVGIFTLAMAALVVLHVRNRPRVMKLMQQRLAAEDLLALCPDSFYMGKTSSGPEAPGGYGAWALTRKGIHFKAYVGKFELRLPLEQIQDARGVERFEAAKGYKTSFHGKEGRRLLAVHFTRDNGAIDYTAWYVSGLDDKLRLLHELGVMIPGPEPR